MNATNCAVYVYNHSRSWCKHNDNGALRSRAPQVCVCVCAPHACAGTITCLFSKFQPKPIARGSRTRAACTMVAVRDAAQPTLQLCMFYSILTRTQQQGRMAFQLRWPVHAESGSNVRRRAQFVLVIISCMCCKSASDIFLAATCPAHAHARTSCNRSETKKEYIRSIASEQAHARASAMHIFVQ